MHKYDSYKDSGIMWIGEIPSTWDICRLKSYCSLKGRIGWNGLRADEFQTESYAYLVTGQDFNSSDIAWDKCYQIDKNRYDEDPFIQLSNGDLLITKDGTIGKIAKVSGLDKPACLNSGIFVMKQKKQMYSQGYLYWLLCSSMLKDFNGYTSTGTTILHLYQNVFENMPMLVPSIEEQDAIAKYLDSKCSKIDKVISTQERRIELLKESKQSVIARAVTHGINPKVEMKNSGVEWIGDIPEHWNIVRMRYLCDIITGDKDTINRVDDGLYPFYVRSPKVERINSYSFDGEAVLMAGDGVGAGKVLHYATGKFDFHQRVYNFHNFKKVKGKFLYFYLKCLFKYKIEEGGAKNTVDSVRQPWLKDFFVCLPPIQEQVHVLEYIEKQSLLYDRHMEIALRQIELLKEYKQSLITEVVTGKRKVI